MTAASSRLQKSRSLAGRRGVSGVRCVADDRSKPPGGYAAADLGGKSVQTLLFGDLSGVAAMSLSTRFVTHKEGRLTSTWPGNTFTTRVAEEAMARPTIRRVPRDRAGRSRRTPRRCPSFSCGIPAGGSRLPFWIPGHEAQLLGLASAPVCLMRLALACHAAPPVLPHDG